MRCLLRFSVLVALLVGWAFSPMSALATTPLPQDVPTADILRSTVDMNAPAVVPTADVLRGAYDPAIPAVATVPRADVLRGPYAPVIPTQAVVPTADVLRGPIAASKPQLLRGEQPLADVLRRPYEYTMPVVIAQRPSFAAWIVGGIALVLFLFVLGIDLWRRPRVIRRLPPHVSRPVERPH